MSENQFRWPCSLLWNRLSISSFGRPRFCVADWKEHAVFHGVDLRETTIKELWQSERYDKLRRIHLEREFQKIGICKNCTDWIGLKWDYDYKVVLDRLFADNQSSGEKRETTDARTS